jgi:hypothetical protein
LKIEFKAAITRESTEGIPAELISNLGRIFKGMQRRVKLQQIGRKYFDPL